MIFLSGILLHAETSLYDMGEKLYFEKGCSSCHGTKAEGMAAYPLLANRPKGFLTYKLKRFRENISENQQQEMMLPFARALSDGQIDALTTFLNEYRDIETERYNPAYETWGDGGS